MRLALDASPAGLEHSRLLRVTTSGRASPTCDESVTLCDHPAQNQARMCPATQRTALAAAIRLGDQDAQARVHRELGFALGESGRFDQAHAQLGRALELCQLLGDQDGEGRTRLTTGVVLSREGRYREAIAATQATLHPAGNAVSQEQQAIVLNNLGWFHARLGELGIPFGESLDLAARIAVGGLQPRSLQIRGATERMIHHAIGLCAVGFEYVRAMHFASIEPSSADNAVPG